MTYSNANFTPGLKGYSNVKPFRFWCQKVLPLVYDDSLSYYELLCKVVDYLNNVISDLSATEDNVGDLLTAYNQLQDYVNNYFTNLDVQEEINNKLDAMFDDGTIPEMIEEYIDPFIETLNENYAELDNQINETMETQNENIATLEGRVNNLVVNNTTNLTGYNVVSVEEETGANNDDVDITIPIDAKILEISWAEYIDINRTKRTDNMTYVVASTTSTTQTITVTITDENVTRSRVFMTYAISQNITIAELTDIRTGYDGTVYSSAGNAVRGQVSDLKNAITLGNSGEMTISGSFSYGIFNNNNFPEADPRKFNAVMMQSEQYDRDITITAKTGYNFLTYWYNDSDEYVGKSANWETARTIQANTNFRLWVRQNPLDTSVTLDLDTVKQNITFNAPIQDEIEASTKNVALANANVNLNGAGLQMIDTVFAYGKMDTTTGQAISDQAYKWQVIMPNYVTYDRDVTIKCNSGYRYQVWWYNEDDTYISRTGSFKTDVDEYTVTAGTHFRMFVTLNPPQSGVVVPIETFASNVFIKTQIGDRVTAVETKPLSTLPEYILNTMSYRPVGQLSKGYILLSCDDGTAGLATYTIPMLISKGVPATFGLLMTSPVITNESYLSTVLDALNNHGCCVAQHGSAQWTTYAEDALNKYFDDTETLFANNGISEIHGAICPGGAVDDTDKLVQAVAGGRFGSVFSGGMQGELKYGTYNDVGARTNMYAMARYSAISFTESTYKQAIDEAYDNHWILCPFWHDYSVADDTAKQAIIEGMIDYAKAKGLTFITMADLPNII